MPELGYSVPDNRLPARSTSTSESNISTKRKGKLPRNTVGHSVEAGKALTKAEREQRRDSLANIPAQKTFEEQQAEEQTWGYLWRKIWGSRPVRSTLAWISRARDRTTAWIQHTSMRIDNSFEQNLAPNAAANARHRLAIGHMNLRGLTVTIIFFLIALSTLRLLVEYLLEATRVSAQCNASTVFYPVTYTYTTSVFVDRTVCPSAAAESKLQLDSPSPTVTRTATSTFFSTTTLFVTPSSLSAAIADPASTTPFMFTVESGTTSWINGNSPPSGASLVVATTTVGMLPQAPTTSADPQTTLSGTATVNPPDYASTSFSMVSPDTTSTTHITRTLTVSHLSTVTRSSFSGVGSAGWNSTSTSSSEASPVELMTSSISGTPTTATMTNYWASGNVTYSTTTDLLTTTIYGTAPADSNSTITGNATTVTEKLSQIPTTATVSVTVAPASVSSSATQSNSTIAAKTTPMASSASFAHGTSSAETPPVTSSFSGTSGNLTSSAVSVSTAGTSGRAISPASVTISKSPISKSSSLIATSLSGSQSPVSSSDAAGASTTHSMPTLRTSSEGSAAASATTANNATASASSVSPSGISLSTESIGPASLSLSQTANSLSSTNASSPASSMASLTSYSYGYGAPMSTTTFASSSTGATPSTTAAAASSTASETSLSVALPTSSLSSLGSTNSLTLSSSATISSPGTTSSSSTLSTARTASLSSRSSTTSGSTISSPSRSLSSTTTSSMSTSVSGLPTPTTCGEHGDFTLNFDDLPTFSSSSNDTDITQAAPIFNPYHHLSFSDGYVHAPPPGEPFPPHSGSQLAVFTGNASGGSNLSSPSALSPRIGHMQPGEVGDGPYDSDSAYWFNAYGAWLGCDNSGPDTCVFNVTGYTWDAAAQQEVPAYNTEYNLPSCPGFKKCQLQHINFPPSFVNLTGIQIQASVDGQQRMFFMDDLALGWSNNTCAAGLQREGAPGQQGGTGAGPAKMRIVRR